MAKERSDAILSSMNRRKMLGTGVGLLGSAVTISSGSALAQEKRTPGAADTKVPTVATGPNLTADFTRKIRTKALRNRIASFRQNRLAVLVIMGIGREHMHRITFQQAHRHPISDRSPETGDC